MSIRDDILEVANRELDWGDEYKPDAERMKDYFSGAGVISRWGAKEEKAIQKAVSTGMEPVLWGKPISWCGIFATWVLVQAGLDVRWISGRPQGQVKLISGRKGIQPGDIAVVKSKIHHFIVVDIVEEYDYMHSIDGNQDYQTIRRIKSRSPSSIWYYYRING